MILQPINDNIILKLPQVEKEIKTKTGIFIGNASEQARPDQGVVIAVGEGRLTADGKLIPLTVKEGQTVIYNKFAGTEITSENQKYLIIKETDILVIVK